MADEIEYTQIKDLAPVTSVKDSDIFVIDDGGTEEKKASMLQIKENTITRVNEILNANYPTNTDMENAIADAKPKVSEIDDNIVEMKPDGLYVSEKNSGIVPSMTQAEYDAVQDKQDGRIREITDAEGSPIPFAILNDEMETASNVWSAQKVKELVTEGKTHFLVDGVEKSPKDIQFEYGTRTTSGVTRTITLDGNYSEMLDFELIYNIGLSTFKVRDISFNNNVVSFTLSHPSLSISSSITCKYKFVGIKA